MTNYYSSSDLASNRVDLSLLLLKVDPAASSADMKKAITYLSDWSNGVQGGSTRWI